jgi:hypothetical protein
MGQLISVPPVSSDAAFDFDRRPKTISECMQDGKVNGRMYHEFKKRSYEELNQHVVDLLFNNSLLLHGEDNESNALVQQQNDQQQNTRTAKRKRKEKQVVMYTDVSTGVRCRLHPRMSLW